MLYTWLGYADKPRSISSEQGMAFELQLTQQHYGKRELAQKSAWPKLSAFLCIFFIFALENLDFIIYTK